MFNIKQSELDKSEIENGQIFAPKFDEKGLITVVTQHAKSDEILMVAFMNEEALRLTIELKEAVYFSRSRNEIWHKGKTSGQFQKVISMRTDCDQDAIVLKVLPGGDGGCCHVGYENCFYREVDLEDSKTKNKALLKNPDVAKV
ncbi:MAG: phosphoribosyl-AMP cyclohydrolase [Alphaproteobacteria bacterium]|nr:phosphoribosyl-AMP cyclohydrolase [Alphaproteobacteria bacterium]